MHEKVIHHGGIKAEELKLLLAQLEINATFAEIAQPPVWAPPIFYSTD